eukprot:m.7066 g.7066  ORF g.7066 m.7066 type:complete len:52 (-) comp3654_c0_seq1:53-208(-)
MQLHSLAGSKSFTKIVVGSTIARVAANSLHEKLLPIAHTPIAKRNSIIHAK